MKFKEIAEKIIELKDADLELRDRLIKNGELGNGYNDEMEHLHNKNANELNNIIDKIGYPTIDKVGKEGSEAAWLIIQHSIGQPDFMKKCVKSLGKAVIENDANPIDLAYLSDRIAAFEGKPQLYGTSFDWDENGEMSPKRLDDLNEVNRRRKSIGLKSMEEQIQLMIEQVEREKLIPPGDLQKRKKQYDAWRKKVGWIE